MVGRGNPTTPSTAQTQQRAPESILRGVNLDRERLAAAANMDAGILTQASLIEFNYEETEGAESTGATANNTTASG